MWGHGSSNPDYAPAATGEELIIFTKGDNGNQLYFELINQHLSLGKQITGAVR